MLCRLCRCTINDNNFDKIGPAAIQMLEDLLQKLDVNVSTEDVICTECNTTLQRCFSFKSAFVSINENVLPSINCEDLKPCLKDISPNESNELSDSSEQHKICKFCKQLNNKIYCSDLYETKENMFIVDTLRKHMPEFKVNLTEDLIACKTCLNSLQSLCSFVNKCLGVVEKTEEDIKNESPDNIVQIDVNKISRNYENNANSLGSDEYKNIVKTEELIIPDDVGIKTEQNEDDLGGSNKNISMPSCTTISEGIHKCNLCTYETINIHHMFRHLQVHEPPQLKCELCPFRAKLKRNMEKHMLKHTHPTIHKCEICSYETTRKFYLNRHMLVHKNSSEVTMYKCELCPFTTKYKKYIPGHLIVHKSSEEVTMQKCRLCSFETRFKGNLRSHMLIHQNPEEAKMYKCTKCSFQTNHRTGLSYHLLAHKNIDEVMLYKCDFCTYSSRHKKSFKGHLCSRNDSAKPRKEYKCDICSFKSVHRSVVSRHLILHKNPSEATVYKCASCKYETRQKHCLARHMLIHKDVSKVTTYKCNNCSFQSKWKTTLRTHMSRHIALTSDTAFKCDLCSYATNCQPYFKRHMRVHEKPVKLTV